MGYRDLTKELESIHHAMASAKVSALVESPDETVDLATLYAVLRGEQDGASLQGKRVTQPFRISDAGLEPAEGDIGRWTVSVPVDLVGVSFDDEADFSGAEFHQPARFAGVRFGGSATFMHARFQADADFAGAEFSHDANFASARFDAVASFVACHFVAEANFIVAEFRGAADFVSAQFDSVTSFLHTRFLSTVDFRVAHFTASVDFMGARFAEPADFESVRYWRDLISQAWRHWWWSRVPEALHGRAWTRRLFWRTDDGARALTRTIRWLANNRLTGTLTCLRLPRNRPAGPITPATQFIMDPNAINEVTNPRFKRYVADQFYVRAFCRDHRGVGVLWRWSCDYGRSLSLPFILSLALVTAFAGLYRLAFHGQFMFTNADLGPTQGHEIGFWNLMYYSAVTFTTLGFGDIAPASLAARFCVMVEVVAGYVMLGGLISILANKVARRS